jgi:hypothetical protein
VGKETISVGDPYPQGLPQQSGEGLWPHLVMEGVNLIFLTPALQDGDLETLRRQKMQVGLKVEEAVPFFTVFVKRWGYLDGHLNTHQYEDGSVWEYVEGMGNKWSFIIAEGRGRKRIVRLNRVLGVEMEMAELAQEGLANALEEHEDPSDVERAARNVYNRYQEPRELAAVSMEKSVFGAKF